MRIGVADGNILFAKYVLKLLDGREMLCFNDNELAIKKQKIQETYTTETLVWDPDIVEKAAKYRFSNRSEAENYLLNDVLPDNIKVPIIEAENKTLKQRLTETEDVLLQIMFGG